MEHELFQSKLKPFVDPTLLPRVIRGSSSGESPHRTAIMRLIFGRSIQERRERVSTKAKIALRSNPTTKPKSSDADISIPQVQSLLRSPAPAPPPTPTPIPASQLPSPSSPNPSAGSTGRPASPSVKCDASLHSLTPHPCEITGSNDAPAETTGGDDGARKVLKHRRKGKKYRRGVPPADEEILPPTGEEILPPANEEVLPTADKGVVPPADKDVVSPADKDVVHPADEDMVPPADDMGPPPSEVIVELACRTCHIKQPRIVLRSDLYCNFCYGPAAIMKCVYCGTMRIRDTETCTDCRGRFK